MTEAVQYVQLNLRVDKRDKQKSEEVLHLMGSTVTELVRKVLAMVACGASEYSKIESVLDEGVVAQASDAYTTEIDPLLAEGWAIGQAYLESMGIEASSLHDETGDWDQYSEEAMLEKGLERGWLS